MRFLLFKGYFVDQRVHLYSSSHSLCLLKLTLESPGRIRKMECNLILSVYIYLNFYYLVTYCPIFISNYFVRP